ncbi:MAG: hypothetical protein LBF58_11015 [Deltaproteobacteria bacterium]|jgi:hypothetical protein|nr:hypothetical protein [Deltaproteobacteria bacterium]
MKSALNIILVTVVSLLVGFSQARSQDISYDWELKSLDVNGKNIVIVSKMALGSHVDERGSATITGLTIGCSSKGYRYVDIHFMYELNGPYSVTLTNGDGGNVLDISNEFDMFALKGSLRGKEPEKLLPLLLKYGKLNTQVTYKDKGADGQSFGLDFREEFFKELGSKCDWKI